MTARAVFDRFVQATLANSVPDMVALYSPDAAVDRPFAPPTMPNREVGTTALRERLLEGRLTRRQTSVDDMVVHETPDPDLIIAELQLHGEVIASGERYSRRLVLVIRTKDDLIVSTRFYWDAAAVAAEAATVSTNR